MPEVVCFSIVLQRRASISNCNKVFTSSAASLSFDLLVEVSRQGGHFGGGTRFRRTDEERLWQTRCCGCYGCRMRRVQNHQRQTLFGLAEHAGEGLRRKARPPHPEDHDTLESLAAYVTCPRGQFLAIFVQPVGCIQPAQTLTDDGLCFRRRRPQRHITGVNTAGDIDNVGFSHRMVTTSKQPRKARPCRCWSTCEVTQAASGPALRTSSGTSSAYFVKFSWNSPASLRACAS